MHLLWRTETDALVSVGLSKMKNKMRKALMSAGIGLATITAVGGAQATTYTFSDGASASGSINTSTGVVVITNAFASTVSAADEISGLQIIFSTTPGAIALGSSAGQLINIDAGAHTGTFVAGAINHWGVATVGSTLFLATAGTGSVGGQPDDLIIGPGTGVSSPFTYASANASTDVHSPSIWETGTFTLTGLLGLTITGIKIEFGTTPDSVTGLLSCVGTSCLGGGGQTETPLPAALPLFASGLGAMGFVGWRRKRKNAAAAAAV
jgi:hypothetical protein